MIITPKPVSDSNGVLYDLLKGFEGLGPIVYRDPAGIPTLGVSGMR